MYWVHVKFCFDKNTDNEKCGFGLSEQKINIYIKKKQLSYKVLTPGIRSQSIGRHIIS